MNRIKIVKFCKSIDFQSLDAEWILFQYPDEQYSMLAVEMLEQLIKSHPDVDMITFEGVSEPTVERLKCPAPIVRLHKRVINVAESHSDRKVMERFFQARSFSFACYRKSLLQKCADMTFSELLDKAKLVLCANQHFLVRLNKEVDECEQVGYLAFIKEPFAAKRAIGSLLTNTKHMLRWMYVPVLKWRTRHKLHKYLPEVVNRVHFALKNAGVSYIVDFGALIGFMREGWFLKHDLDVDFCILPGQSPRKVCEALEVVGFKFVRVTVCCNRTTKLIMVDPITKISVDIFLMYEKDGRRMIEAYFPCPLCKEIERYSGWRFWRPNVTGITEKTFRNAVTVMIPDNFDELLTVQYGDWRHPDKHFDHVRACKVPPEIIMDYAHQIKDREFLNK